MNKNRKHLPTILLIFSTIMALTLSSTWGQSYQQVTTISGSTSQTTDYFKVSTGEWRIKWSYTPSPDYPTFAVFSVFIYPKGEAMFVESIIQSGGNNTNGVTYIHQGNKEYYMKINAANINGYTITVEAQQPEPSPTIPETPLTIVTVFLVTIITAALIIITKKR